MTGKRRGKVNEVRATGPEAPALSIYDKNVFDPEVRGKTDRFALRIRNPE